MKKSAKKVFQEKTSSKSKIRTETFIMQFT